MQPWQPANQFEQKLLDALSAGDERAVLALIRDASLAIPLTAAAAEGSEPFAWPTIATPERTWVVVYTSVETMRAGSGDPSLQARPARLPELAAAWPDHRYGLAINPGLPAEVALEPAALARIAAPTLVEDRQLMPSAKTPMMFKLLRHSDVRRLLQENVAHVSGYCHQAVDIASVDTADVLIAALGRSGELPQLTNEEGSVNVLRWPAVGLELYPNPIGGTDEAGRAAVEGWLVEEPPFGGMGFTPGAGPVVREYKVANLALPHGADICELTADGTVRPRAYFDADRSGWLLLVDAVPDAEPTAGEES